jgi:hypothetical protein
MEVIRYKGDTRGHTCPGSARVPAIGFCFQGSLGQTGIPNNIDLIDDIRTTICVFFVSWDIVNVTIELRPPLSCPYDSTYVIIT